MAQLQDSTSLVQRAADLGTTSQIRFEKSPGRDAVLCIQNLHGQLHSCSSVLSRPLSITLCSSAPGMSLRGRMHERALSPGEERIIQRLTVSNVGEAADTTTRLSVQLHCAAEDDF